MFLLTYICSYLHTSIQYHHTCHITNYVYLILIIKINVYLQGAEAVERTLHGAADGGVGGSNNVLFSLGILGFPKAGVQDGCPMLERLTHFDLIRTDNAPDPPWWSRSLSVR